ncbi:TPA: DNA repair and recombination protein RadA [archaeon]|uniref:DNA repair and recombination protein RadA n=1 Tax=Candidatus Naiadarchaeum limnaeum TaxID=2756139 RepID=A0A832V370_9ARCH|nr:DNA repair and recombination protein RadA [Candidatus Naiadarchaeales archaeon SRR2090153.bin1042]HIK00162.1 DNA repair and recombination protein RadA [Candidatus Naiadarchaeum limnaeum]
MAKADYEEEYEEEEIEVPKGKKGNVNLEDISGIGPATAKKLEEAGFKDLKSIATMAAGELAEIAEISDAKAKKIIAIAKSQAELGFETADKFLEKRREVGRLTTGSKVFDKLLSGGMETQSITECFGEWGSGKSQMGMQLCVNVQLPVDKGGLGAGALVIDSEHTFRPERIVQMAKAKGLDPVKVLKNIIIARAYTSDDQMLIAEQAHEMIQGKNIKLVVVDSLTSLFRSEYTGRGTLAPRQQKLNRHLSTLHKLADLNNLVVYVTNQVMSNPQMFFGDPTRPIGGHILGHSATFRIYLRKSKAEKRIARLIDSPNLPDGEAVFKVTEDGIGD